MNDSNNQADNTYSEQRFINIRDLEQEYNATLDSYLNNYEHYLKNKSQFIFDTPSAADEYKSLALQDNQKLLMIIRALYNNIRDTDQKNNEERNNNINKRHIINKNKEILEKHKNLLLSNKDELLTTEAKINYLEKLYRGKYSTYTGVLVTDVVIGILLMIMLIFSF
tara:strand:+ start:2866 stop:3366 length:501 start_codon:yes stop_codon:yes gene_type:complete